VDVLRRVSAENVAAPLQPDTIQPIADLGAYLREWRTLFHLTAWAHKFNGTKQFVFGGRIQVLFTAGAPSGVESGDVKCRGKI
jgi:hypothetical protein